MLRIYKPYGYKPITDVAKARLVVFRLFKRVRIPYTLLKRPGEGFAWDGEKFNFKDVRVSDMVHHFAHYLIASKDQRRVPEFGLGDGFDTGARVLANRARMNGLIYNEQEEMASMLGIFIERQLELPWKRTYVEHNWTDCDYLSVDDTVDKLFRRDFLYVGGKVRFRV